LRQLVHYIIFWSENVSRHKKELLDLFAEKISMSQKESIHSVIFFVSFCVIRKYVGFEVRTVVVMKSSIFWDIMPCSPLIDNRHLGGALLATCFHAGFLLGLFFDPEGGGDMFL
jgi:hypothetical protein